MNSFHTPPTMLDMTQKLSVDIERVFSVEQREAAEFLQKRIFPELLEDHFFLVGGTALALRFGHRRSIDLDFFSFPFNSTYDGEIEIVDKILRKHGIYHRKDIVPISGQLHCQINNVMVLFAVFQNFTADHENEFYQVPLYPPEKTAFGFDTLSLKDLAGMKAFARCHRSKMKDLVDIGEILTHGISLQEIIDVTERQFGYDISGKEILESCLNIDDILDNAIDEPIVFLNNKDTAYYIDLLKMEVAKYYHANI
jgi:hypothetical protein